MLHVVTAENAHLYQDRLREMFELRRKVFVLERGWDLDCDGEREIDQFDGEDATYFLYLTEKGDLAATFRMLPTTGPHLMSEVFPHLCWEGVPRGPHIYEATRALVKSGYRSQSLVWESMMTGIYEYCLLSGIEWLTAIFDLPVFEDRLRSGVDFRPLGPPTDIDGEMSVACYRVISLASLQVLRAKTGLKGPSFAYIRELDQAA